MRKCLAWVGIWGFLMLAPCPGVGADENQAPHSSTGERVKGDGPRLRLNVPLFSERFASVPLALVGDEPITVADFARQVSRIHGAGEEGRTSGKQRYGDVLTRLIDVTLVVQEARNMGLGDLPAVQKELAAFADALRTQILLRQVGEEKGDRPEEGSVDALYLKEVQEVKLSALLFPDEESAQGFKGILASGRSFEELAQEYLADGRARGETFAEFRKTKELAPSLAEAIGALKPGGVGPVTRLADGFVVVKVHELRLPEIPEVRAWAEETARSAVRARVESEYKDSLIATRVKIAEDIVSRLYEDSGPGWRESARGDTRVVAEVDDGGPPITVAELTEAIEKKLYHGAAETDPGPKMKKRKRQTLMELALRRLLEHEARQRNIDELPVYRDAVRDQEYNLLFGQYLQKVVLSGLSVTPADLEQYYGDHRDEFPGPRRVRLRSIACPDAKTAEAVADRLRSGTDFGWLKTQSEGTAPAKVPSFEDQMTSVEDLPAGVAAAVEGVQPGDVRVFQEPDGGHTVLLVRGSEDPTPLPLSDVSDVVRERVSARKVKQTLEEAVGKLREFYEVTVYLDTE